MAGNTTHAWPVSKCTTQIVLNMKKKKKKIFMDFFNTERKEFLPFQWYSGAVLAILKNSTPVEICKICFQVMFLLRIAEYAVF
jgi:hypothetical protein